MYNIDFKYIKKKKFISTLIIIFIIIIILLDIICCFYIDKLPSTFLTTLIILIPFLLIGVWLNLQANKRISKLKKLNEHGILIKKLPYKLVETGMLSDSKPMVIIQAEYTLQNGTKVKLWSDEIYIKDNETYNNQKIDDDGLVDLLIDPNDYSNYYLNFSINRIDGNHPNDYYINKKEYMFVQCPNCGANKYDENDNCLYCGTKVIVKSYVPNK